MIKSDIEKLLDENADPINVVAGDIIVLFCKLVKECEDKYPMTGKPDKEAAYKNGWYDCAYEIRHRIDDLHEELQGGGDERD